METISSIYPIVNVVLFIGSLLFWITQKYYKETLVFALVQLATAYCAVAYMHMSMQELVPVMGVFYALSAIAILIHTRIRLNRVLKHG